jgi:hypothetical protein
MQPLKPSTPESSTCGRKQLKKDRAFRRIKRRLPRRNLFLKLKPIVAKEKMEPVSDGNEFCGTLKDDYAKQDPMVLLVSSMVE